MDNPISAHLRAEADHWAARAEHNRTEPKPGPGRAHLNDVGARMFTDAADQIDQAQQLTYSERGFALAPALTGLYGGHAAVHESSLATQAAIWIAVTENTDESDTRVHLSMPNALALAAQIVTLAHRAGWWNDIDTAPRPAGIASAVDLLRDEAAEVRRAARAGEDAPPEEYANGLDGAADLIAAGPGPGPDVPGAAYMLDAPPTEPRTWRQVITLFRRLGFAWRGHSGPSRTAAPIGDDGRPDRRRGSIIVTHTRRAWHVALRGPGGLVADNINLYDPDPLTVLQAASWVGLLPARDLFGPGAKYSTWREVATWIRQSCNHLMGVSTCHECEQIAYAVTVQAENDLGETGGTDGTA